jgi:tRNA (guanine37-N1)-methyltransferase
MKRMPKPKYQFTHLTAVPGLLTSYFSGGVIGRAIKNGLIRYHEVNLHNYGLGRYKAVDDTPYGGGPGMLMRIEPIFAALKKIKRTKKTRVILFEAAGKPLTQADVRRYAKAYNHLVFISGRYEGVDARVHKLVDERVSVGPYVLSGGELAAAVAMDSVSRLVPGVLGKSATSTSTTPVPNPSRPRREPAGKYPRCCLAGTMGRSPSGARSKAVSKIQAVDKIYRICYINILNIFDIGRP